MKYRTSGLKKPTQVKLSLALLSTLLLAACGHSARGIDELAIEDFGPVEARSTTNEIFTFSLSSSEQVPPVTQVSATGDALLSLNTETGELSGTVLISQLSGPPTMAHLHQGLAGTNGDVLVGLEGEPGGDIWVIPDGTYLTQDQLTALNDGELYINIHTQAHPAGELRGQVLPATIQVLPGRLTGSGIYLL